MKPTPLLLPFSWLFGAVVGAKNLFFDLGLLKATSLPVPVLSVGSLSAGGSGKTPFVALLARMIRDRGKRVAIVSRGYGRKTRGYVVVSNGRQRCAEAFTSGDEPAYLADHLDGVIVVVDEVRSRGARNALRDFKSDVIILDDAFQHRSVVRTHDIVLMTAREILEPSHLLPAGYRREPLSSLERAEVIVVTKCRNEREFEEASGKLTPRWNKPMAGTQARVSRLIRAFSDEETAPDDLKGKAMVAVSGIADPRSFEETVFSLGARMTRHLKYPDHHWFDGTDLNNIQSVVEKTESAGVVTTEKDLVRLKGMGETAERFCSRVPVLAVVQELSVIVGGDVLEGIVASL